MAGMEVPPEKLLVILFAPHMLLNWSASAGYGPLTPHGGQLVSGTQYLVYWRGEGRKTWAFGILAEPP